MCAKDKKKILKVAIDVPVDQLFDYLANDELIVVGQYVTVSFGRRKMVGVVCAIVSESSGVQEIRARLKRDIKNVCIVLVIFYLYSYGKKVSLKCKIFIF